MDEELSISGRIVLFIRVKNMKTVNNGREKQLRQYLVNVLTEILIYIF